MTQIRPKLDDEPKKRRPIRKKKTLKRKKIAKDKTEEDSEDDEESSGAENEGLADDQANPKISSELSQLESPIASDKKQPLINIASNVPAPAPRNSHSTPTRGQS